MAGEERQAAYAWLAVLAGTLAVGPVAAAAERAPGNGRPVLTVAQESDPALGRRELLELQRRLRAAGYYRGRIDGRIGPATRRAIEAFEGAQGRAATGEPSAALLAELRGLGDNADGRKRGTAGGLRMTGHALVIDGDTLAINGVWVRLYGIDAPESEQTCSADGATYRCGQQAALALKYRVDGRTVACREQAKDANLMPLAVCSVAGQELNAWMVAEGWALADRARSPAYAAAEEAAKAARKGVWQGQFTPPWEWRQHGPQGDAPAGDGSEPAAPTLDGQTAPLAGGPLPDAGRGGT